MRKSSIVSVLLACLSCHSPNGLPLDTGHQEARDIVSFTLFTTINKGYGFEIVKNGKPYIWQPFIPTRPGFQTFPSPKSAGAVAILIVQRLQKKNFRFLLQDAEIDSIMKEFETAGLAKNGSRARRMPIRGSSTGVTMVSDTGSSFLERLPLLPDAPIKEKWVPKGLPPFGDRTGMLSFSMDFRIFVGGGDVYDDPANDFWCYNSTTQAWTCMASFQGGRRMGGVAFSLRGRGYWGLGQRKGIGFRAYLKDLYEYDPEINQWHKKRDFPGTPRIDPTALSIGDKAYIGLGFDGEHKKDFYEFDPLRDSWRRMSDFGGGPVSASLGISIGTKGFVIAGDNEQGNQKFMYEYLPRYDRWIRKNDFPGNNRYYASGGSIDTESFLAGSGIGLTGKIQYRDFYVFNTGKDSWTRVPDYLFSFAGNMKAASGGTNGEIFILSAFNPASPSELVEFENYYSVRADGGDYNETTCYPLRYDGKWGLFQECSNEDCFAGVALKTNEQLGQFCYKSRFVQNIRNLPVKSRTGTDLMIFPRNFVVQTERQPTKPAFLRLFFTKDELNRALSDGGKAGLIPSIRNMRILQCNETYPDMDPFNNELKKSTWSFIKPKWYCYGVREDILVAEFPVSALRSEFYLVKDYSP